MAQIRFPAYLGLFYLCGGSLIDDRHVLTAAHCLFQNGDLPTPANMIVYLGGLDKTANPGKKFRVKEVFYPHQYLKRVASHFDIAVLRLTKSIKPFTNAIKPICLPAEDSEPYTNLTVAGFGTTNYEGKSNSKLNEVGVEYIPSKFY